MAFTTGNSPLLQNFQDYYYELLRQKEKALRMSEQATPMQEHPDNHDLVFKIQKIMRDLLESTTQKTARTFGHSLGAHMARDAEYIMVTLTDEIFLNLQWSGVSAWQKSLLEAQIFQTQVAGELFFKKLDALLEAKETNTREIALLYFLALSLGFRGKFKGAEDEKKIRWYMDQLYIFINNKPSQLFNPGRKKLFDQCYDYDIITGPDRGLPDVRIWTLCILAIFVLYFFVTYVAWYKLASDLYETLSLILQQTNQSPLV
jgi:type VI secretion system protein ImpK